jgi:hypothetical protein
MKNELTVTIKMVDYKEQADILYDAIMDYDDDRQLDDLREAAYAYGSILQDQNALTFGREVDAIIRDAQLELDKLKNKADSLPDGGEKECALSGYVRQLTNIQQFEAQIREAMEGFGY